MDDAVSATARFVGLAVLAYTAVKAVHTAWRLFLRPGHDLYTRYGGGCGGAIGTAATAAAATAAAAAAAKPVWAVVTGASDGLGKEFSRQLARQGFNILLVSRTESKLKAVETELHAEFPAGPGGGGRRLQTRILVLDFASVDPETLSEALLEATCDLDVGLVVNNAGLAHEVLLLEEFGPASASSSSSSPSSSGGGEGSGSASSSSAAPTATASAGDVEKKKREDTEDDINAHVRQQGRTLVRVNCDAFTAVLTALLPGLVARTRGGVGGGGGGGGSGRKPPPPRSGIINVSSASALYGLPYNAVYAGSKGFNRALSQSLAAELRLHAIDVLCFMPFLVSTNMTKTRPNAFVATAPAAIESCLRALGHEDATVGCFQHQLQAAAANYLPSFMESAIVSTMKATRKRLLRKRENKNK